MGAVALAVAWVHWPALSAFFSSPEDLNHLQQAVGLKPVVPTPFRYLSQVLYFRLMVLVFGLQPTPFHAATLIVHAVNACLVYAVARQVGVRREVCGLSAVLFGAFPLFNVLVASAIGMNDEIALTLALSSILALWKWGHAGVPVSAGLFTVGMLCKESVIGLPLVAILCRPPAVSLRNGARRATWLLGIAGLFAVLFAALRPVGLAPDRVVYATGYGANLFHALMTYLGWSFNLTHPIPDLVSSYDASAWRIGIWYVAGLAAAWSLWRRSERAIGLGVVWFVAGIAPILPLLFQTYRHYLYPALPGLTLAVAGSIVAALDWAIRRGKDGSGTRAGGWRQTVVIGLCALAGLTYAAQARTLVLRRVELRIPRTGLAVDPVIRRREVAQNALGSLAALRPTPVKVAILEPRGTKRVFGARSAREYPAAPSGEKPYRLLEESLDRGHAIKLFIPAIDSVVFLDTWNPSFADYFLLVPYTEGVLEPMGRGSAAHVRIARWLARNGYGPAAAEHLRSVARASPADPLIRRELDALERALNRASADPNEVR